VFDVTTVNINIPFIVHIYSEISNRSLPMNHTDHVNLLRPANLIHGSTWADFGAGAGAFTLALRELLGSESDIIAVDRDRLPLSELQENWRRRFGRDLSRLRILPADFTHPLDLPPLDGILMANSLHFFKNKEQILRHITSFIKPGGALLLVEYNVDLGNPWVPYPLSFETWRKLAPQAGFSEPQLLATAPSSFLHGFYSAQAYPKA
jgi:ubiquinone/menaquinone biosynthesis C-methylase UbiE